MQEVQGVEATKKEGHMTSAAAFVEGGLQTACGDDCSICLEDFCESDPSTVTSCIHEFHLHCILEWCQRSSHCPMCWQSIVLKDPSSQELLKSMERERTFRSIPLRNATIFHHPTIGDFELPHLTAGANDPEHDERLMQQLTAAYAFGRSHRNQLFSHASRVVSTNQMGVSNMSSASRPLPQNLDRVGPSELQSVSESLKSRFNAASMRYKESISRSTREWKERLFSRNTSVFGSEVQSEAHVLGCNSSVSSPQDGHQIAEHRDLNDLEVNGQNV